MNIPIELYASFLLVIRIISMTFIFMVLKRQWGLFKIPIQDEARIDKKAARHFRRVLFILALIIFIGNIIPAGIDIMTLITDNTGRPRIVQPISVLYTMTASGTALLSSYLIWRLYRLAAGEKIITDRTQYRLEDELKEEKLK